MTQGSAETLHIMKTWTSYLKAFAISALLGSSFKPSAKASHAFS
jgi:hypothetical protein